MASEIEKLVSREKQISKSSPWILAMVAAVFLLFAIAGLLVAFAVPDSGKAAAGSAACFGIAAIAFVAQLRSVQSKINLEIAKAINDIRSRVQR